MDEEQYVSSDVKSFVKKLNIALRDGAVDYMERLYEVDFNQLTESTFHVSSWPSEKQIAPFVNEDNNFLVLYKEMYFRHIYAKLRPSVYDRFDSFQNYIDLFNIILGLDSNEPELEIPSVWLWDIINDFVYQFRSFHQFRNDVGGLKAGLKAEEIQILQDAPHVWSAQTVVPYFHALVAKAEGGSEAVHPFFHNIAEFALIGLCQLMCILSDYHTALQVLDDVDLTQTKRPYYLRVTACYTSLNYYMSFACMMVRRYSDAIDCLTSFLSYVNGNKNTIPHSYQEDTTKKQIDHMHGLLAVCHVFAMDHVLKPESKVQEMYGDKMQRMLEGDVVAFEEIFNECSPKFINTCIPDYDDEDYNQDAHKLQLKIFTNEVKQRPKHSQVFSYLKLCSSISIPTLCKLLECDEETLSASLLSMKHKTGSGSDQSSQCYFFVEEDSVHVIESKSLDKHGEYFMRAILKYEDLIDDIKRISVQ